MKMQMEMKEDVVEKVPKKTDSAFHGLSYSASPCIALIGACQVRVQVGYAFAEVTLRFDHARKEHRHVPALSTCFPVSRG